MGLDEVGYDMMGSLLGADSRLWGGGDAQKKQVAHTGNLLSAL